MAGTLKPYAEAIEAPYIHLGGVLSQDGPSILYDGSYFFDGILTTDDYGKNYIYSYDDYVKVRVDTPFYFWRVSSVYADQYPNELNICDENDNVLYTTEKRSEITNEWKNVTPNKIPPGTYLIKLKGPGRVIDTEWFFENADNKKYLVKDGSDYKTYDSTNGWTTVTSTTPTESDFLNGTNNFIEISDNLFSLTNKNLEIEIYSPSSTSLNYNITVLNKNKLLFSDNFSLNDINEITDMTLNVVENSNDIKILITPNDGVEYYTVNSGNLIISSLDNISTTGMSPTDFNTINEKINDILNTTDKKIKFVFYLDQLSESSFEIDSLSFTLDLVGTWDRFDSINSNYESIFIDNKHLKIKIKSSGKYKINY